jgi:hypothetical protein
VSRPFQPTVAEPGSKLRSRTLRTIAPLGRVTVTRTAAGRASVNRARMFEPRGRTQTVGWTESPASVLSSRNTRSAAELCPWSSTAATLKRHLPSGSGDPSGRVPVHVSR